MAKSNDKKKNEKAKKGKDEKLVAKSFADFYRDHAVPKQITHDIKEGNCSLDDIDVYNSIKLAGMRIDPQIAVIEQLPRPALKGVLDAWYENSSTKLMDYVSKPRNLEIVISDIYTGRVNAEDILGMRKDKNGKPERVTLPLMAPNSLMGYKELSAAHQRFYNLATALKNKDRGAISKEIAPAIEKTVKAAGVSNPEEWVQLFSYLASVSEAYAFNKASSMLGDAYNDFKKFNSLKGEQKREYFGNVIGSSVTKDTIESNPAEVERALDLLYAYTAKEKKK
jgi:uncharacterized protein YktA (UPF0223 family)